MFFDHGNIGGGLFGLLLLWAGLPAPVVWIGFAAGWILSAWPDLAPVFDRYAWRFRYRSGDWRYRVSLSFLYDWSIYNRYHSPREDASAFVRLNPFFLLHRLVDLPAHHIRVLENRKLQVAIYVLTAVLGVTILATYLIEVL